MMRAFHLKNLFGYWKGVNRSEEQELKFSVEITKDPVYKVLFNSDAKSSGDNPYEQ